MSDSTVEGDKAGGEAPAPGKRSLSVRVALVVAVVATAAAIGATRLVLANSYGVGIEALFAALALAMFGIAAYGVMQAVLALVDSAGERRRQDREVSERRTGDRARQPKP